MRSTSAVFPPGPAYAKAKEVQQPVILDWDIAHPIMQYIRDLSLVYIAKGQVVDLPPGAKSLIDGNQGSLAFVVAREGFTDTVVTFPLMDGTTPNTTWFRYISFPLFIFNSIQALGNVREGAGEEIAEPGRPVVIHAETPSRTISVTGPARRLGGNGGTLDPRDPSSTTRRRQPACTSREWENNGKLPFAVNLFDERESDLAPRGMVPEGAPTAGGKLQDQDRLQPRYRHPEAAGRPQRHLVVLRPARPRRACSSSGIFIIGGFISDKSQYQRLLTIADGSRIGVFAEIESRGIAMLSRALWSLVPSTLQQEPA